MSNVWWINHTGTYERGMTEGVIYAGYDVDRPVRTRLEDISPGDIKVHSPPSCIRAVGLVQTSAEKRTVSFRDKPGRVADVEYHEFTDPFDFQELAAELYSRDIQTEPIYRQENHFSVLQGYCHSFNHRALAVIRDLSSTWPPWPQARFPARTQVAVDFEEKDVGRPKSSFPEKREHDISRVVRDSQLARRVKERSDYQCQVCDADPIGLPNGTVYAEAHHLHPLSEGGPDDEENIICVCPTCHVKLDYCSQELEVKALNARSDFTVSHEHVRYHNKHVVEGTES
jgi:hypothetical protein